MRTVIIHRRPIDAGGAGDEARWALVRAVSAITSVVVGVIVVGILLIVLDANPANDLVNAIVDAARWLAGPFRGLFRLHGDWRIVVNWGLAAIVYGFIGRVVAAALAR